MKVEQWLNNNQLAIDIWKKKYQYKDETFEQWLDRVSSFDKDVKQLIIEKKFLFGGRILSNRGLQDFGKKVTYSNCYVISPPEDNIESIFECASKLARTFSYGGGCGIDISKLSPRGAKINNSAKETTGAVSFMELYNLITTLIGQNGRRGALMLSLSCDHPDLEEFISIKNDLESITKANISIRVTDEFMKAVVKSKYHNLTFVREETGEIIQKRVYAPKIFRQLCENNWNFAEPGILYWDNIVEKNLIFPNPDFSFAGVNPCAEEPLPAGGSCLLGSLNLSAFVYEGIFDITGFKKAVKIAVRALNEVLDEGLPLHPLQEQQVSVYNWKQIGLGIFGLADMLIKMGVRYGSEESIYLCDDIARAMFNTALQTSAELADEKGTYPMFNRDILPINTFYAENSDLETLELVDDCGLRNSQLLTIAPTGSLSTMLGVSGGIEPIFDTHYVRKTESLHGHEEYYTVYTPIVEEYMKKHGLKDISELPDYFVTSKTLNGRQRVDMQAVWQKYIDASISSTVNLPETATVEEVEDLYIYAWKKGLKGLTIFRDNCARLGVLTTEKKEEEDIPKVERTLDNITPITREDIGVRLNGSSYVKQTACGKLYITINRDENDNLVEVFIDPGKSGGCVANAESLGRMASSMMRAGMTIDSIVDCTKGVKCSACTQVKASKAKKIDGLSCGDIVARTIQEEYERYSHDKIAKCPVQEIKEMAVEVKGYSQHICPECGDNLANEGGCVVCKNCGYSKCD